MRLAIIPARGGSKRIKNKNIVDFLGKPIISYSLESARKSKLFDEIHVSTDSDEISRIAGRCGFKPEFMRPAELSDDHTPLMPVLRWVINEYQSRNKVFETICLLMPCSPLIDASDLIEANSIFEGQKIRKPLLAVSPFPVPLEWAFQRSSDGSLTPVQPGAFAIRSQDLDKKYFETGTFCFYDAKHILSSSPPDDKNLISYVLPRNKAVDIDGPDDLAFAEALFKVKENGVK